jgi:hypothetical protein
VAEREAAGEAADREDGEDEPGLEPPWPKVATTAASTAAHAPMRRKPITVARRTTGFPRTLPNARRLRGMRTRPTSGRG